jgi:TPR repeat protein
MKTKTPIVMLICNLVLGSSNTGRCEGTNGPHDLFGITVTQKTSEAEAQFALGSTYYSCDGEEQDLGKASECFLKAAELGHAQAQFNLGLCYMNGYGVEQSNKHAAQWFKKATEQEVQEAYYPLGICYYNLEQYTEAYAWALYAESKGDTRLKEILAPMLDADEIAGGTARFEKLKKSTPQTNQ